MVEHTDGPARDCPACIDRKMREDAALQATRNVTQLARWAFLIAGVTIGFILGYMTAYGVLAR